MDNIPEIELELYSPHQLTIWDEYSRNVEGVPASLDRFVGGVLSQLMMWDLDRLVRVGRIARRESARASRRGAVHSSVAWEAVLQAASHEWHRRHEQGLTGSGQPST